MSVSSIAKYFMIGTLLIWGAFDLYLYFRYGNAATESATTWRYSYLFPGIPFSIGALMGHFFAQWRIPSPTPVDLPPWRQYGRYALLALMAIWVGSDVRGILINATSTEFDGWIWAGAFHQVWLIFFIGFGLGSVFLPMDEATSFQFKEKK
jgi:hypothetical protein